MPQITPGSLVGMADRAHKLEVLEAADLLDPDRRLACMRRYSGQGRT